MDYSIVNFNFFLGLLNKTWPSIYIVPIDSAFLDFVKTHIQLFSCVNTRRIKQCWTKYSENPWIGHVVVTIV